MFTILQVSCVVLVTVGILIEVTYGSHFGFVAITVGSLAFAVSTKLRKIALEKEIVTSRQALAMLLSKKG